MMDPPLPALLQSARYTEVGAVVPEGESGYSCFAHFSINNVPWPVSLPGSEPCPLLSPHQVLYSLDCWLQPLRPFCLCFVLNVVVSAWTAQSL